MGPVLETKGKSKLPMEVLEGKENESAAQDSKDKHTNNSGDERCLVEAALCGQDKQPDGTEYVEVDIVECRNSVECGEPIAEWDDATESSSSFGGTVSETDDGPMLSDTEVESRLGVADGSDLIADGFGGLFPLRRKRLTDHWRRFIRPLMWRCKWVELQIKELQSQALKYDRELADHEHKKQLDFETFLVEDFHAKSHPFSSCAERKVMKRKKRRKLEEITDIGTYLRQHNLFSYYENQRSGAIGTSVGEDRSNLEKTLNGNDEFGFQDEWKTFGSNDGDNISEDILRRMETLQLQARKLKARIEKVISENPKKFASVNRLSLLGPSDALNSFDQNPVSPPENGDRMPVRSLYASSQHISEHNMEDHIPESAVSSHGEELGEVNSLPDMVKGADQPHDEVPCNNTREIPKHTQPAKGKMRDLKDFETRLLEDSRMLTEAQNGQTLEAELPTDTTAARVDFGGKSLPKSRLKVFSRKRKRGGRKSGTGGWNRKSVC